MNPPDLPHRDAAPARAPIDAELGALRSTHLPVPLWRSLLPAALLLALLLPISIGFAASARVIAVVIMLPFLFVITLMLAWSP